MNWRIVVTLSLFILAIVVIVSGVALYVGPPGSLKQAVLLGLTRTQWSDLHTVSALAMAGIVILHVWFNRRALVMYFKRIRSYEAVIVAAIAAAFVLSPLISVPPASWIIQISENAEASWVHHYTGAKGFGFMTLSEFCSQYNVPLQKAISYLKGLGLSASPSSYLRDLAERLGTTPASLAEELLKLKVQARPTTTSARLNTTVVNTTTATAPLGAGTRSALPSSPRQGQGLGLGLLTLKQYCDQYGIPLERAINYIKQKYGAEVTPEMTIRDIAFSIGLKPYQLIQELNSLK